MAVASDPPSNADTQIASDKKNPKPKRNPSPLRCSSSSKRVRCAKDQVFRDGVDELETMRSCHQCRQKSSFLVASCKDKRGEKLCSLNFCRKCLLNRYGEKAEEVGLLNDWKCPKCRDICNCSACMKKKGKQPTGNLVLTAKATGFSSVSEMLAGKENETLTSTISLKEGDSSTMKLDSSEKKSVVSPRKNGKESSSAGKSISSFKAKASVKEPVVASPGKGGKENIFAGRLEPNLHGSLLKLNTDKKNIGVCKRKNIGKKDVSTNNACLVKDDSELENTLKKSKILNDNKANNIKNEDVKKEKKDLGVVAKTNSLKISQDVIGNSPTSVNEKEKKATSKNDIQKMMSKFVSRVCTKNDNVKRNPGLAAEAKDLKKSQGVTGTLPNLINGKEKNTTSKCDPQKSASKVVFQVCSKNEDVSNPGAAAEAMVFKKFQDVSGSSPKPISEHEKKLKGSKSVPQKVTSKGVSQKSIKKDGKVLEVNLLHSHEKKKIPDNGDNNSRQLECSTNININKVEDAEIEKKDNGVMPKEKTLTKSLIVDGNILAPNNSSALSDQKKNLEDCMSKEDKIIEKTNSVLVGDKTVLANGNNDGIQSWDNVRPDIFELNTMKAQHGSFAVDTLLPQGIDLTNVAGIDLPAEDVGHALQFLEFCGVFGKFFHLMKGQAESILRELTRGCTRRSRTQHSSVVQFHIQLLSLLLQDSGEKSVNLSPTSSGNSWLPAIEKCISESKCSFDDLPSNCFNKDGSGYYILSSSQKLRLLNFLCDEALCTADLRTWIDEQNSIFFDEEKEAKQTVTIAKNKEKQVKQQIQDEMDNFINSEKPLSISEHDGLVLKLKIEADKAHAEYLEAIKKIPNYKQRSDALRTDPIFFDGEGHVFWKLKCCNSQRNILVQEIGSLDTVSSEEKWFTYDAEQKGMVEKYISSSGKRVRLQRVPNVSVSDTNQA